MILFKKFRVQLGKNEKYEKYHYMCEMCECFLCVVGVEEWKNHFSSPDNKLKALKYLALFAFGVKSVAILQHSPHRNERQVHVISRGMEGKKILYCVLQHVMSLV